jgi:hypothetical protein
MSTPATMEAGRRTLAKRLAAVEVKSTLAIITGGAARTGAYRSAVAAAGPDNNVGRATRIYIYIILLILVGYDFVNPCNRS